MRPETKVKIDKFLEKNEEQVGEYRVLNLMTKKSWQGPAKNAKEAYAHIKIKKGDTTKINWGRNFRLTSVKEW